MASRDLNGLVPTLKMKHAALVAELSFPILTYCTGRSAEEQSKLWRQSRSMDTILAKEKVLIKYDHIELARILIEVGPHTGPHVTHAGPGESWHQYWMAFDAVPMIHGKPAWNYKKNEGVWSELGSVATNLGINWGGNWKRPKDYPHCQIATTSNPLKIGVQGCILKESDLW